MKKKQNIIDLSLLKDFFYLNHNRWIIGLSIVLFACIFLYFFNFREKYIFPSNHDFKFEVYNDSANGGNSKILRYTISDTLIDIDFDLKEGFLSPYIGLSITPLKDRVINLSHYNIIHIDIEGQKINSIGISLYTRNTYKNFATNSTELRFHANLEISPEKKQYDINLNQLKIPDWWCEMNHISPNERIEPDLKQVLHINIGTAYTPILGAHCSLRIHSISLERNNEELILLLISLEIIVIFFLIIIHYYRAYSKKKDISITIAYKPVNLENENRQLEGFLNYINNNFRECDLSLEQVSNHTGVNQRRIANSIQLTFGCNFKTYINQIRINESKRLLKESELNMGEIAFKVGFSNQSHFNRVFKSLVGINPSEFRESNQ